MKRCLLCGNRIWLWQKSETKDGDSVHMECYYFIKPKIEEIKKQRHTDDV